MKITAVNGSPRRKGSNSFEIINLLRKRITGDHEWTVVHSRTAGEPEPEQLQSDVLLIVYPLYVDGLPASLLRWLTRYREAALREGIGQGVYAAANCGFHEGIQNATSLKMVERFALSSGLAWRGGIGIGTGEMIRGLGSVPPEASIRRPVFSALDALAEAMDRGIPLKENIFTQHNFPWLLYKLAGEAGWRKEARKNGLSRKQLFARPLGV